MTSSLFLSAFLVVASGTPAKGRPVTPTLEAGQREFKRGDYPAAMRALEAAAAETQDDALLSKIHLLRGQCFAAQQDFSRAEEAFDLALEKDPEAALDPTKVDPALVKVLDGLRARLRGELSVSTAPSAAAVALDGKALGDSPVRTAVAIGRHTLSAKTVDGRFTGEREVVVRARRETVIELALLEQKNDPTPLFPSLGDWRPVADVRATFEPVQWREGPGFELGGGLEWSTYRVTGHLRLVPDFGLAVRGALRVPVADQLKAQIELELPVVFLDYVAVGLGGSGGVEYEPSKWIGFFAEVGGKHYFSGTPGYERNRLIMQAGVRLRPP